MSLANVRAQFGEVVARVVDGVTKLDRLEFDSKEAQQAATIRKMFLAMATDWRVLLIKLADRLHNMRTIAVMPEVNQRATAQETLDVYAPLAHRLGVQQVKWQLEDLAFATLQPKRYAEIEQMVASRTPEREQYVAEVIAMLRDKLARRAPRRRALRSTKAPLEHLREDGRERQGVRRDLRPRRAARRHRERARLLGDARHAARAVAPRPGPLQGLHQPAQVQPVPVAAHDGHRPNGKPIEVQIRTQEMHRRAEYGIAAHWGYKEHASARPRWRGCAGSPTPSRSEPTPVDFLEALKLDLEQDEVYVFTPKGRVIALAANRTPVDFAYAVHTEVGHHCVGAKVNGRLVPLDTPLNSADVVEILTSKAETAGPSRDWMRFVASTRARAKIRQWFSRERREDSIETGREELVRALRRAGLPIQTSCPRARCSVVGAQMNLQDLDGLLAAIGENQISAQSVVQRLQRELTGGEEESLPTTVARGPRSATGTATQRSGVYVEGLDDVMVHLARAARRCRGTRSWASSPRAAASRCTAPTARTRPRSRASRATGSSRSSGTRRATTRSASRVDVRAFDRGGLLADVSTAMAESHLNILAAHTATSPDRVVKMTFEVELADPSHLASVLTQLKHVDGVFDAYRQLPGRGGERGGGSDAADEAAAQPEGNPRRAPAGVAPVGDADRAVRRARGAPRVRARAHADVRGRARLPPRDRRGVRGRRQGDVRVRRPVGRRLALRPEGTAPIVRAFVQHRPPVPWRVWYVHAGVPLRAAPGRPLPPAPPAGRRGARHRGPRRRRRGDRARPRLLRATSGSPRSAARSTRWATHVPPGVPRALLEYFLESVEDKLCDEHATTWRRNPLRVLDCKRELPRGDGGRAALIATSCEPCEEHFARVLRGLDAVGVAWTADDRLVRGLDYYTRTTFEFAGRPRSTRPGRGQRRRALRPSGRGARRPADAGDRLRRRHRAPAAGLRRRGRAAGRAAGRRRLRRRRHRRRGRAGPRARCGAAGLAPSAPTTVGR